MAAKRPKKIRDTWNLRISKVKLGPAVHGLGAANPITNDPI